jgi:hypothetical protein
MIPSGGLRHSNTGAAEDEQSARIAWFLKMWRERVKTAPDPHLVVQEIATVDARMAVKVFESWRSNSLFIRERIISICAMAPRAVGPMRTAATESKASRLAARDPVLSRERRRKAENDRDDSGSSSAIHSLHLPLILGVCVYATAADRRLAR